MMKRWQGLLVAAAIVAAIGLAGNADLMEAERQAEQYCKMVDIYHESGGEYGWPPYDGECDDD